MSETPYLSPLSPSYWRTAAGELRHLRILIFASLMAAASVVMSSFFIPFPMAENLRIYFTFTVTSVCALVCGPVVALLYGFASDIIGFVIHPTGAFFPGYTLSTMLGAFVFALFFYRRRITLLRIILAKLLINAFINVGLGSLWSAILYNKGYYYFLAKSLVKNSIMLPVEILILIALFRLLLPILADADLIPRPVGKNTLPVI